MGCVALACGEKPRTGSEPFERSESIQINFGAGRGDCGSVRAIDAGCRRHSVVDSSGTARDPSEYSGCGRLLEAYGQAPPHEVLVAMHRLEAEEGTQRFKVPLDGFEVAELIGKEGPDVGATLTRLMEHRLDSGPLSKKEAIALVLDWKNKD